MDRDLHALTETRFDLLIVGGGAFGAAAAWDAVLRGLSVALIDKGDFCSGVSANSFKMVHGGIRYIQHGDVVRLRNSCAERSALLRIAPHLVQPLPIVIPTYGHGKKGKALLGTGMVLYDLLTADRNRGIRDPARRIPWSRFWNARELLDRFPDLPRDDLTGAAVFCDGQMYNPTRLVLAFLSSAVEEGAHIANYVKATGLLVEKSRILGVRAKDQLAGEEFEISARCVLNTAGPWAENLLETADGAGTLEKGTYSRDACFVIKRRFDSPCAIALQGRTRDPDAWLSRPARHLFLVPWRDYTLVGVWHLVYTKGPDRVSISADELATYIDEINGAYPGFDLSLKDITLCNAGLVPFGENTPGSTDLSYGKRSRLIDHAHKGLEGLVTLIGIRYTMGRGDARRAVDFVCRKLGHPRKAPATERLALHGGSFDDFDSLVGDVMLVLKGDEAVARALAHNYGSDFKAVLAAAREDPELLEPIRGGTVLKAEIRHAVRSEMAFTLSDIVFRRTDLATGGDPGSAALQECGSIMARELGWGDARIKREIERVRLRFPRFAAGESVQYLYEEGMT